MKIKYIFLFILLSLTSLFAINELFLNAQRSKIIISTEAFYVQKEYQGIVLDNSGLAPIIARILDNHYLNVQAISIFTNKSKYHKEFFQTDHTFFTRTISNVRIKNDPQLRIDVTLSFSLWYAWSLAIVSIFLSSIIFLIRVNLKRKNDLQFLSLSRQVAHDIRSPLSALDMIVSSSDNLPDEERRIVKHAVRRIHDIANNLLNKSRPEFNANSKQVLLGPIIESLVSEKRIQYRSLIHTNIDFALSEDSLGLFLNINESDLKRILSNLINNSVEALKDGKGKITVKLSSSNNNANIEIIDDGAGIPDQVLKSLSTSSPKSTKSDGNAIGLKSAKEIIEKYGGSLEINTKINLGTTIQIKLPLSHVPEWYQHGLTISSNEVVIIDDDKTIHQLWNQKLGQINYQGKINNYTDFTHELNPNAQYLIDYEFLGKDYNGLAKMIELKIPNAILVTSHYDEEEIQIKCINNDIKIIPKSAVPYLQIKISPEDQLIDLVLLDDDELIRLSWEHSAQKQNKKILCFAKSADLMNEINRIPKRTPIYLDSELGEEQKGQDIALKLSKLGFKNLILCTGHSPDQFDKMDWITEIQGKSYPS